MAKAKFIADVPMEERNDPGDNRLTSMITEFIQRESPKELQQMKNDGSLDEYLATTIRATRRRARSLIGTGEIPAHAWRRATRVFIYGKDED